MYVFIRSMIITFWINIAIYFLPSGDSELRYPSKYHPYFYWLKMGRQYALNKQNGGASLGLGRLLMFT